MLQPPSIPTLFPYTTLFRSERTILVRVSFSRWVSASRKRIISPSDSSPSCWQAHDFPSHRSEEHTSELQSRGHLVCRLLLEKKKSSQRSHTSIPKQQHTRTV